MAFTPDQLEFQTPAGADHLWVETMLFPIVVPDAGLYAFIYVNVRPTLGVMWNQVIVCGCLTDTRAELLHYAENPHLPAPPSLADIRSPLGLRIQATDPPRQFRIDYVAAEDGTEIHVDWESLMDPFDIHDPAHSPQAGKALDIHADLEPGERKPVGHVDMHGRATGVVRVRGNEFIVNAVERMDRSWGARDPMKAGKPNHVISATISDDLAFHMICPWNPARAEAGAFQLSHGYVLDHGQVFGLTDDLTMTSRFVDMMCTSIDMTVTDVRGQRHHLVASPDIGAPWIAAPSAMVHLSLMRWRGCGRDDGYGIVMTTQLLADLNRELGRFRNSPRRLVRV